MGDPVTYNSVHNYIGLLLLFCSLLVSFWYESSHDCHLFAKPALWLFPPSMVSAVYARGVVSSFVFCGDPRVFSASRLRGCVVWVLLFDIPSYEIFVSVLSSSCRFVHDDDDKPLVGMRTTQW